MAPATPLNACPAAQLGGRRLVLWLLGIGLAAGLASGWYRMTPASAPLNPLPDFGVVPSFSLLDQDGRPFARSDLDGSVWIADFIFTRCAGQCPLLSNQMATLQKGLANTPVQLVSISVDPEYDVPRVLKAYAQRYGARANRWRFATGSRAQVQALTEQGFHLSAREGGPPAEPILHSVRLVLVDRGGRIRGYYDATEPQVQARLFADARRLLQEAGP